MHRSRGFTLIELLVVIAIIAVLMAVLMPALNRAKELGQGAACKGNLKGYYLAVDMYCTDNDGKFPDPGTCYFSTTSRFPVESGVGGNHLHLRWCNGEINLRDHPEYGGHLFRYLADARSFICPTFKTMTRNYSEDHFYVDFGSTIRDYEPWYNYTMNAFLGPPGALAGMRVSNLQNVKHPATTFSFTEESSFVDADYNISGLNDTYMVVQSDSTIKSWLSSVGGNEWAIQAGPDGVGAFWDNIAGFHHSPAGDRLAGRGNCAFLDGHVEAHYRSETFGLAWPN